MLEVKAGAGCGPAGGIPADGVAIAEAARRTGVSVHTLRYYERAGLVITPVDRTDGGRSRYRQLDLDWIVICTQLRTTGMPIWTIRRYAELVSVFTAAGYPETVTTTATMIQSRKART